MKNSKLLLLPTSMLAAALLLAPHVVVAEVPDTIPIQGRLTDADGIPLEGNHTVHFALYDEMDNEIYSESQVVGVEQGDFTAYLGTNIPLDPSLIEGEISLGIAVDDDMEMTPRIPFGSVPFAIHAPEVPPGMVSYFDASACPEGWSPLAAAQGRTIVGMAEEGMLLGQVGTPLGDVEDRTHSHTVNPPSTNTTSSGDHTHNTASQAFNTGSTSVAHTHSIPALTGDTDDDTHNHRTINGSSTYDVNGNATIALGTSWSNPPGIHVISGNGSNSRYTNNDTHDHAVTTNASNTGGATSTSHNHSVSVPQQSTTSAGSHSHSVDIAAVASSSTSSTMPYLQLLACRKD